MSSLMRLDRLEVPDQWEDIIERDPRPLDAEAPRSGGSRLLAALVAACVALLGIGIWAFVVRSSPSTPRPALEPTSPPTPPTISASITQTVDTGLPFPEGAVSAYGGIWVATRPAISTGGDLIRIDPATGAIGARIGMPAVPGWTFGGAGIAAGRGSIWIAADGTGGHPSTVVYRVDPDTHRLAETIDVGPGNAADVWVDDSGIWVLTALDDGSSEWLYHLDPDTHDVLARIDIPANWSNTVVGSGGWIWVLGNTDDRDGAPPESLFQIDPTTDRLLGRSEPADGQSFFLEASADRLWFFHDGLRALDGATGTQVVGPMDLPEGCCAGLVSDGAGGVWVSSGSGNGARDLGVWHVTRDGTIDQESSVDPGPDADGIAATFDAATTSIWVVHYRDTVSRLLISEEG
jgi:hypothetical protein